MRTKNLMIMALLIIIVALCFCFILPGCDTMTLDKDYSFSFDAIKTTIWDVPGVPLFFAKGSGLELKKDGNLSLTVILAPTTLTLLEDKKFDLSAFDLDILMTRYAEPILPWFDRHDLKASFAALKQNLGAELILDYEEEATKKIIASVENTGKLNSDFTIPKTFGFRYTAEYKVKKLTSAEGKEYFALYVDKFSEDGEPFIIITLDENENGQKTAKIRIEFLKMTLSFVENETVEEK
ncbi:MAG: hypothetical protein SO386_03840 [Eubacteriales bacterium]|nr:hypothetical protein [Eubacteriales bacterium]